MVHLREGPVERNITEDRKRKKPSIRQVLIPRPLCSVRRGAQFLCYNSTTAAQTIVLKNSVLILILSVSIHFEIDNDDGDETVTS